MYDYVMGVGRSPQVTQDAIINTYSAYNEDIAQYGTISGSLGAFMTISSGIYENLINPNYTDTAPPLVYSLDAATSGNATIIIDLKRRIGLGKYDLDIDGSYTATNNPTISITFSVSDDNISYQTIYTTTSTAPTGTVTYSIDKDTFSIGKFTRYFRIYMTYSGSVGTSGSVILNKGIKLFPDYTQY